MDHIETKTHGLDVAPTRHGCRAQSRSMLWSRIIGNGVYSNSEYSLLRLQGAVNMKMGYGMLDIRSPREVLDEEDL